MQIQTRLFAVLKVLQDQTKTPYQIGRSVVIKVGDLFNVHYNSRKVFYVLFYKDNVNSAFIQALNMCNGGVTYGAIMAMTILLGYGDSVISYKTQAYDMRAHTDGIFKDVVDPDHDGNLQYTR